MKTFIKKIACIVLAAVTICAVTPAGIYAASGITYDKNVTYYLNSKSDTASGANISISNLPAKQTIAKSSIKIISGKSIASLSYFGKHSNDYKIDYIKKGHKSYKEVSNDYNIYLNIKKAGTAKVSFKVGNKTYVSTVKTLPYTNPNSSLTITGVKNGSSSNLASKFKNSAAGAQCKVNKAQKNAVITCKAASGWKIVDIYFSNKNTNIGRDIYKNKGVSSLSLRAGNLVAGQKGYVDIQLVNTKTGGMQYCTLYLGNAGF